MGTAYPQNTRGGGGEASGQAKTALILGIVGFLCCQLCGPVAWFMGAKERSAIRSGWSSQAGEGMATAGMILGIISTVFLILGLIFTVLWFLLFGGLAVLGSIAGR
ncbi:MAG: DUF4190 domain-containing protein [Vicinamibacteria bacterium]|jgi:hypothetical protein|nr:DUF4190 domain-containing protein [Vicinamibacteria bacterium]